jgi:hypothetical protein
VFGPRAATLCPCRARSLTLSLAWPQMGPAGRFNIVIVFVIAEKYEIPGSLVAVAVEGYDNRYTRNPHRLDGQRVRFQNGDAFGAFVVHPAAFGARCIMGR